MESIRDKQRVEKKYLLSRLQFHRLDSILSKAMHEDEHNQDGGYFVRTLYFDTLNNLDFFEKENGMDYRKKVRLRSYDDGSASAHLELKEKQGEAQHKVSIKMGSEDVNRLLDGEFGFLLDMSLEAADNLYGIMAVPPYRPVCLIEYRRKAYTVIENDIRITFDYELKASESDLDLFGDTEALVPIIDPDCVVMEVKYSESLLEYVKRLISPGCGLQVSVSKYCLARSVISGIGDFAALN